LRGATIGIEKKEEPIREVSGHLGNINSKRKKELLDNEKRGGSKTAEVLEEGYSSKDDEFDFSTPQRKYQPIGKKMIAGKNIGTDRASC